MNPKIIAKKLKDQILEPKEFYEGIIVFSSGAVVLSGLLWTDDRVIGVSYADLSEILSALSV